MFSKVWETKDDQAKKAKSRLERRLARKKEDMELDDGKRESNSALY